MTRCNSGKRVPLFPFERRPPDHSRSARGEAAEGEQTQRSRALNPEHEGLPLLGAFDDGDIAVEGKIGEALDGTAGLRPPDFQPVEFCAASDSEQEARVMRGKIASAGRFGGAAFEI